MDIISQLLQHVLSGGMSQQPMAQPPQQAPTPSQPNPFDAAAARIGRTEAASRFTKAPIQIENLDKVMDDLGKTLGTPMHVDGKVPVGGPANGGYDPETGKIQVNLSGLKPSYKELKNAIDHETVHSLMSPKGQRLVPLPDGVGMDASSFVNALASIFHPPQRLAERGFDAGNRAGNSNLELPSYITAYQPGQLKDFTPEDRDRWMRVFMPKISPQTRKTLSRILAAHDSPLPTTYSTQ